MLAFRSSLFQLILPILYLVLLMIVDESDKSQMKVWLISMPFGLAFAFLMTWAGFAIAERQQERIREKIRQKGVKPTP